MILTGVEAGMEDGFGLELVYFQLDSNGIHVANALQCLRDIGN